MPTASLQKIGDSVMLAVPDALLSALAMGVGSQVDVRVECGCLVITPAIKPRYSLDQLLAECDLSAPYGVEESQWLNAPAVGREVA